MYVSQNECLKFNHWNGDQIAKKFCFSESSSNWIWTLNRLFFSIAFYANFYCSHGLICDLFGISKVKTLFKFKDLRKVVFGEILHRISEYMCMCRLRSWVFAGDSSARHHLFCEQFVSLNKIVKLTQPHTAFNGMHFRCSNKIK